VKLPPGIFFEDEFFEYSALRGDSFKLKEQISPIAKIFLRNPNALELLTVLLSLGDHVDEICVFPPEVEFTKQSNDYEMFFEENEFQEVYLENSKVPQRLLNSECELSNGSTKLTIFTSGTSGIPKRTTHLVSQLVNQFEYQKPNKVEKIWGLMYQTSRMAAIQVFLNSFSRNESVVCTNNQATLREKVVTFGAKSVNALSGTPSMFRYLSQFDEFCKLKLIQVTLGGELVDQKILDTLKGFFPHSRITHIYASTEVGFGFAVSDGLSGFPAEYLSRSFERFTIQSINDELVFVFPGDSLNSEGFSVFSGDVVLNDGNRVYFVGRRSGMVNVGGSKVFPEEVEETIRGMDGVSDAYVYSVKSSQMGEILKAKVICEPSLNQVSIRSRLKELLPSYKVPALIDIVEELPISASGKILRS
jgi:acyl-CoA synthetase (AMP-forming)/AMP-acid ligase II